MTNILPTISPNTVGLSPNRPLQKKQNRLGPYDLLQTLGEGEFGKVKLGIHTETGQEVAIKLIKKEGVGSDTRITKVEREISILKTLNHPYIVKLYNVLETEKYIGIILEYAPGGELFGYILAHRYLKEHHAKRFFAQLMSSVQYMHKRKIVHRDLKLENLLLDKNRNIIVTDFGFANQFSSAADDLMATTCGSPCYAAPELVVNGGLYAGSAVDIWSCGVILYAMLCGFLPFDDDPSNPDSDNIGQLYRYILSTHLMFPSYVSPDARSLLEKMLVPDPTKRCSLDYVVKHPWLESYRDFLKKDATQLELEYSALEKTANDAKDDKAIVQPIMVGGSMSTIVHSTATKKLAGVNLLALRKTHKPVATRDRFTPKADDKYLFTDNKAVSNNKSTKNTQPSNDSKINSFRHFSIGRFSESATPIEKSAVYATATVSKVPNFINRKSVKKSDELATTTQGNNSMVALNPEKSLSSPLLTQDSKIPNVTTFGNLRRNQRRGTDKFLSFFTSGGRTSHNSIFTKPEDSAATLFTLEKKQDSNLKIIDQPYHQVDEPRAVIIGEPQEEEEEEERQASNPSSEMSTIRGYTPSLSIASPISDTSLPLTPIAPNTSSSDNKSATLPNESARTTQTPTSLIVNDHRVVEDNNPASRTTMGDTIQGENEEQEQIEKEAATASSVNSVDYDGYLSNISHQQHQARNRGSCGNLSINSSIDTFKDASRRTPYISSPSSPVLRNQQHNQYYSQLQRPSIDNGSSVTSASSEKHNNDGAPISAGTAPQPEVSSSTRLNAKLAVTNAMNDGGRKAMAAVRRNIYGKHVSQPPPQKQSSEGVTGSINKKSAPKEPFISFAKSKFEEMGAQITQNRPPQQQSSTTHRNTWSATTLISSVSEIPGKKRNIPKPVQTNESNNKVNVSVSSKKTGKKMMDWIKKKSQAKEKDAKKEATSVVIPSQISREKSKASTQQTSKPRNVSVLKELSTVSVLSDSSNHKSNDKNATLPAPTMGPQTKITSTKVSKIPTPSSPQAFNKKQPGDSHALVISPRSTRSLTRAASGNEATLAANLKKNLDIDTRIQIHQGAIDRTALTSLSPINVIKDVARILRILGIETKPELHNPFVLRCSRRKAKSFIAAQLLQKNQDDKGDENDDDIVNDSNITSASEVSLSACLDTALGPRDLEPIYGDASIDNGDEIRFVVEICRFKNLPGLYIVDARRLRGNAWAYKFLYHKLFDFLDLRKNGSYIHV